MLKPNRDIFQERFNKRHFRFEHDLAGHPLFELSAQVELARRQSDDTDFAYWSNGPVNVGDRWGKNSATRLSLVDTIANIAHNNSLVLLRHIEQDAVLGPMVRELLSQVVALSGPRMREDVIIGRATILIASPRRITAYHIDSDVNHLLQVAGDKIIYVFDQTDRAVISHEELERYYGGDFNGAVFKERCQEHAAAYELHGGVGVHIPCTAPHWAQNGDNVSIALSLNFDLRSEARRARLYQFNQRLRRLGIVPTAPGVSAWRDRLKLGTKNGLAALRGLATPASRAQRNPGWTLPAA